MGHDEECLVYFDLKTAGLGRSCDILQIAMKCSNAVFNEYINSTQKVTWMATQLTGLSNVDGKLLLNGKRVRSYPLSRVIINMLMYLQNFGRPCVLVAHNCFKFDAPRLFRAMRNAGVLKKADEIIDGFADTLPLFKREFPGKSIKLHDMADRKLVGRPGGPDNALDDVYLLEELTRCYLSEEEILTSWKSFSAALERFWDNETVAGMLKTLRPLNGFVSQNVMRQLSHAGISYDLLVSTYRHDGKHATISLIEERVNGKPTVIKQQKDVNQIIEYLQMVN
ncbi:uncharacterized protein LOC124294738 [Neodiprion lecontei]|uniref:Uncharacterized protein LOC124294738 n=1 Tax=Neodiprion lecontei TaxID=441921 RepID=A0ABM3GB75_NEOLC|nr:uncharacterized protein LOC124294738 [Neodiprion lecontei]